MESVTELVQLAKAAEIQHAGKTYWPRWFRNAMAQVILSVEESLTSRQSKATEVAQLELSRLRAVLLEATTTRRDLRVGDKKRVCDVYAWFCRRTLKLASVIKHSELRTAEGGCRLSETDSNSVSYIVADDLLATKGGRLVPSVVACLDLLEKDLGFPLNYSVLPAADKPITLYAPNETSLGLLLTRLPEELSSYCAVELDIAGVVKADTMCVDDAQGNGSVSLFIKHDDGTTVGITAAHAAPADSIEKIYDPISGIDVAVLKMADVRINPVPFSHIMSFAEYASKFRPPAEVKVFKLGSQTGLTEGALQVVEDSRTGSWTIRAHRRILQLGDVAQSFAMLAAIRWAYCSVEERPVPFAVPGDSGAIVYGVHEGRFYPLGLHCGSSEPLSFAVSLGSCLGELTTNITERDGSVKFANAPRASVLARAPAAPAVGGDEDEVAALQSLLG